MSNPQRSISSVSFSEMAERDNSVFLPFLIDIRHMGITWGDSDLEQEDGHLRLVSDTRGVKYKGDDEERKYYAPCVFTVTMPKEDGKTKSKAKIAISCIDQRVVEVIRMIDENLSCKLVAMFAKKTNESGEVKYYFSKLYGKEFQMSDVTWDSTTASWTLEPDMIMDMNIPRDKGSVFRNPSVMSE